MCKFWEKANVVETDNSNKVSQNDLDSGETPPQDKEEKYKAAQSTEKVFKPQPAPRNAKYLNNVVVKVADKSENNKLLSLILTSSDDEFESHILNDKSFSTNAVTSSEKPQPNKNSIDIKYSSKAEFSKPKSVNRIFKKKRKVKGSKSSNNKKLCQPKTDASVSTQADELSKR